MIKRIFLSLFAVLGMFIFTSAAFGQGSAYPGTPMALTRGGFPAAGARVTVCAGNVTVTFNANPPCAPYASIFSDPGLTAPIAQPGFATDGLGNYPFFAAGGAVYTIVLDGSGLKGSSTVWNAALVNGTTFTPKSVGNSPLYVTGYGASGSAQTTTGSCTVGSPTLTLASALDFVNGQGILAVGCGPTPTVPTPTGCVVTQFGTAGSTTYQYQVSAIDVNGGISAPTVAITTSTGNATLSIANGNKISCTVDTVNHPRAYVVWGRTSGSMALLSFMGSMPDQGDTTAYLYDTGGAAPLPGVSSSLLSQWIPASPPGAAQNGFLLSIISSGAGTTTLTLANSASATVSSKFVQHDDTAAVNNAVAAAIALNGTTVTFSPGTYNLNLPSVSSPASSAILYYTSAINVRLTGPGATLQTFVPNETLLLTLNSINMTIDSLKFVMPNLGYTQETAVANVVTGFIEWATNSGGGAIAHRTANHPIVTGIECQGGTQGCVYLSAGTTRAVISNNYFHDVSGPAIEQDSCSATPSFTTCGTTLAPNGNAYTYNKIFAVGGGGGGAIAAISTDDGGTQGRTQINDNYIQGGTLNPWSRCITAGNAGALEISRNYCTNVENGNINVILSHSETVSDISIIGNIVNNCGGGVNNQCMGISLFNNTGDGAQASDIQVIGNSISGMQGHGFVMANDASAWLNTNIVGNTALNNSLGATNTWDGFYIKGTRVTFSSNTSSGNSKQRYGFNVDPATIGVSGAGNNTNTNVSGPFLDSSNVSSIHYSDTGGGGGQSSWTGLTMIVPTVYPTVANFFNLGIPTLPWFKLYIGTAATNNFIFTPTATAAARTVSILDPLANVSLGFSYNATNPVYQTKRGVTGCTTAASIGGSCATDITVTWGTAFPDVNYSVTCTGNAPSAVPSAPFVVSGTKLAASVHINYFAITAVAASYLTIDCSATHD